jgi:methionyl-tRNA formyltransferase
VFPGRRPDDGIIDWSRDAKDIDALVRAVTRPYPGAFSHLEGRKVLIWETLPEEGPRNQKPGVIKSAAPLRVAAGNGDIIILSAEDESGGDLIRGGTAAAVKPREGDAFETLPNPSPSGLGGS